MSESLAWTEKYRPTTAAMVLGNEEAAAKFKDWLKQWTLKRKPAKTACLLVGPPGTGKTSLARAAANDLGFRVVEMNASDVRTEKAIEAVLEPARSSTTLDSYSADVRKNLILIDEVDGVFGREDRGGLGAILSIIDKSPVPIVLTANNTDSDRFVDLLRASLVIDLSAVRPRLLVALINHILAEEGKPITQKQVREIARSSHGDIRSAINDIQVQVGKMAVIGPRRTRELDEMETLEKLFASGDVGKARRVLSETEIPLYRDELLLLLHDILPYVYTSPDMLADAYDALSHADIGYGRIGASRSRGMLPPPFNIPRRDRAPDWSLLPFVINELASVGIQEADSDIEDALEIAPRVSSKVPDRYQYRLWQFDRLSARIAKACHVSKRKAVCEIVPYLVAVFREDADKGREIALGLELEERNIEFLVSAAKTEQALKGPQETLDPTGFKLPYMGKDKFIQLMRAGLKYDRGKFVVRRLDDLDSVEGRVSEIISRPVKFRRPEQAVIPEGPREAEIFKQCYVDAKKVACASCEFVEDCPTHAISALRFCLCDASVADPRTYERYVEKNLPAPIAKRPRSRRKTQS